MDDNTKQNFISWLQDNNVKKLHPSTCIDCLEAVSDYAVKHRLSKVPFWEITDYKQFNAIKNSILSSRIFKFFNRSNAKNFDIAGKLYSDYLKENFAQTVAKPVTPVTVDTSTPVSIVSESIGQEINLAEIVEKSQPQEVVEEVLQPQAENNEQIEIVKPEIQQDGILTVNFGEQADYTFTTVKSVSYFGKECENVNSWRRGYEFLLQELYFDYPDKFFELLNDNNSAGAVVRISQDPSVMKAPIKIVPGIYTEGNRSAGQIVNLITTLLKFCNVDYDNVVIKYSKDGSNAEQQEQLTFINQEQEAPQVAAISDEDAGKINDFFADFFSKDEATELFKKLFIYQVQTCGDIVLDVRQNIIGAKKEGEKLRFYVGNNGRIHFSHYFVDYVPYDKPFVEELFDEYCQIVDKNNIYFDENIEKIKLKEVKAPKEVKTEKPVKVEKPAKVSLDYAPYLTPYGDWLVNDKGLNEKTRDSYCSSIKSVDKYLLERGVISKSVVLCDNEELTTSLNASFGDVHFTLYDKQQHRRFSAALKSFYRYKVGREYLIASSSPRVVERAVPVENAADDVNKRQPVWDIYEAAVLLDGYLKVVRGVSRQYIIADISKKLRQMAINQGKKIDSIYRNTNGISFQIHNMKVAFTGESCKTTPSKVFFEVIEIYNQDREKFNSILSTALDMCSAKAVPPMQRVEQISIPAVTRSICPDDLKALITEKFPYGIRADYIAIQKLRNYAEDAGIIISDNDDYLIRQIKAGGIEYENKIYYISDEVIKNLIENIKSVFDTGVDVIYYEVYYDKNYDWMSENGIVSAEFIYLLLKNKVNNWYFSKKFFCNSPERYYENEAVEREFIRVWGDNIVRTYDELYELLPYIPEETIRHFLSRSKLFVWSSAETFAWTEKLIITEEEKQAIFEYVNDTCETAGYASISDIPLGSIEEENYQISINAIYSAAYNLVLCDFFTLNGKILNKNNSNIDSLTLAKAYCDGKERCTFEELNDYVISLNGTQDRQTAFKAGYSQMVRVDEELFVADRLVSFNVTEIDNLLEQTIKGDFIPIRGIASFALFPDCGYTWNSFVLESFCLKYSKKFRLCVLNYNDKNAGIIAKSNLDMEYSDMLAAAAVNANITLNSDAVGKYLFDNGYTAKSKLNLLDEVVEKAKELKGAD